MYRRHRILPIPFSQFREQRVMVRSGTTSRAMIASLFKQEGPCGFFRGLGPAALTWTPYFSIYFTLYESISSRAASGVPTDELPFLTALGCGLIAGTAAAVLTTPLDVVKTRVQVGGMGALAVAKDVLADAGVAGSLTPTLHPFNQAPLPSPVAPFRGHPSTNPQPPLNHKPPSRDTPLRRPLASPTLRRRLFSRNGSTRTDARANL